MFVWAGWVMFCSLLAWFGLCAPSDELNGIDSNSPSDETIDQQEVEEEEQREIALRTALFDLCAILLERWSYWYYWKKDLVDLHVGLAKSSILAKNDACVLWSHSEILVSLCEQPPANPPHNSPHRSAGSQCNLANPVIMSISNFWQECSPPRCCDVACGNRIKCDRIRSDRVTHPQTAHN